MDAKPPVTHVDYTQMAHHDEIPDSRDSGDPSRPQGDFWRPEECDRGRNFMAIRIGESDEAPQPAESGRGDAAD